MENKINLIWSLDISTTNVGSALWDSSGRLIELKHLELKLKKSDEEDVENRDIRKAIMFAQYCSDYKHRVENELFGNIVKIFVEAPLQDTPKNINTTALLLGFNGMARLVLYQIFNIMPDKITVHDARKSMLVDLVHAVRKKDKMVDVLSFPKDVDKKHYIWEKVSKLEPQINWFYGNKGNFKTINYDMSDSYVVGIAGLIKSHIISKDDWKNKYSKI